MRSNINLKEDLVVINIRPKGNTKALADCKIGSGAILRSHTVIYAGNKIGKNFQTGHGVLIRELNKIGNNVSIGSHSVIEHNVVIEDGARIHSNAFIPEFTVIRKNAWIGPAVVVTNAKYPGAKRTKEFLHGVEIGESAKIGAGSVILPGVKIGKMSLVGAGSVVTKDVPPFSVVIGNPARIINEVKNLTHNDGDKVYET